MTAPTTDSNPLLDAALAYAEKLGWAIIPCGNNKKPLVKWKQYQTERPTIEQVRAWWTANPDANIGPGLRKALTQYREQIEGRSSGSSAEPATETLEVPLPDPDGTRI